MKISPLCALIISALFCAQATSADESWRGKPASEWTEKDVRQILEHSAWAHRLSLILVTPSGASTSCVGNTGPCQRDDSFHQPTPPNLSGSPPAPQRVSQDLAVQQQSKVNQNRYSGPNDSESADGVAGVAVVRWTSAQTVRDALAAWVTPSGKRMDPQELSPLAPVDAYVLYVDLRVALADVSHVPQGGILTEAIARHSSLILKSTGQRIHAVRVTAAPLPEFDEHKELALAAYYIFFPRETGGRAAIPQREAEVRFECPLSPVPIRADFKLSRMERGGSPDY